MKAMVSLYKFSHAVADALNAAKLEPPAELMGDEALCALMVVGGVAPEPPLGAALNWSPETKTWDVALEVTQSERVA